MNGKKSRALRRMARDEMARDPEVEYVAGPKSNKTMVNSPNSQRCMYLQLKKADKVVSRTGLRTVIKDF